MGSYIPFTCFICFENKTGTSLFQALCQCGQWKKRAGDERGLVHFFDRHH